MYLCHHGLQPRWKVYKIAALYCRSVVHVFFLPCDLHTNVLYLPMQSFSSTATPRAFHVFIAAVRRWRWSSHESGCRQGHLRQSDRHSTHCLEIHCQYATQDVIYSPEWQRRRSVSVRLVCATKLSGAPTLVGPPPGLSTPNEGDSSTAKESPSSSPNPPPGLPNQPSGHTDVNSSVQGNGTRHVYPLSFLLALSKSPLIERPSTMPPLSQWYGEWQPHYARGSHNAPHSPMGSFGKGDRHGRAEKGEHGHDHVRGGNNADEFDALGYVMRDSGFSKKERFRRGAEERERMADPMRIGGEMTIHSCLFTSNALA